MIVPHVVVCQQAFVFDLLGVQCAARACLAAVADQQKPLPAVCNNRCGYSVSKLVENCFDLPSAESTMPHGKMLVLPIVLRLQVVGFKDQSNTFPCFRTCINILEYAGMVELLKRRCQPHQRPSRLFTYEGDVLLDALVDDILCKLVQPVCCFDFQLGHPSTSV